MNSLWLILGSLAAFAVAYRLYGAFLATKVAVLNDARMTPAHRMRDGVDYHPTSKLVLFGHHFAAIAGPGPLIGPVLAAQWGYLPGFLWIVIGACMAGAVHDFVVLWASVRQDGMTLPKIASRTIGPVAGLTCAVATLFIIICTLASVALVVVKALGESSWGLFTILVTIPAALITGLWMYRIRPGKVGEASAIGVTIVLLGVLLGQPFAHSAWGPSLLLSAKTLSLALPIYAAIASILPVWVLMCPRDYLSCYMKIGVMVVLAAGIIFAHPTLRMPATTPFLAGHGPVISGAVWPFVCITIMCGAISGFHALIASGTTPKMVARETHIKPIAYGAMVVEGFVAVTALVAACALEPGDYFAINVAQKTPEQVTAYHTFVDSTAADHHWDVRTRELTQLEEGTQEKLSGRTGGAVTLAVGMAKVFASMPGLSRLMGYWYHFVIMFEALFILTLLETGTRVARFVFQEVFTGWRDVRGQAAEPPQPAPELQHQPNDAAASAHGAGAASVRRPVWALNVGMSIVVCGFWGYLLYVGNLDTLWKMLGIANQLLASIALAVGTTYLLLHAPKRRYALCTGIPFVAIVITVFVAGVISIRAWWSQTATAPADQEFLLKLVCIIAAIILLLTAVITVDAVRRWVRIIREPRSLPVPSSGEALA